MPPTTISQTTLLALVLIFGSLPPIVDDWIKHRVTDPLLVGLYTALVGLFFGASGLLLTQIADGSTWADGGKVLAASLISGTAAAIVNYLRARAAKNAGGGAAGGGGAIGGMRKVALSACVVGLFALPGCGWLEAKAPAFGAIGECVLQHHDLPPEQIGLACAIEDIDQIKTILSAYREAAKRDAARAQAARP